MTEDRWGSLFFIVTGVYGTTFSLQLPFGSLITPGPAMYPFAISVLLFICGLILFVAGKGAVTEKGKIGWIEHAKKHKTKAICIIAMAGFILLLETLGFLLSSFLFCLALLTTISRYRIGISFLIALSISLGIWLFFGNVLSVQFPKGV
ncbi:MAG: tripartite tricarboxylate transporter TctB family protein, partial [Desulfobacterales bacterium]|nr:tripartite tricarboxylate transporter TctB family protein [Desulfobacterales bacterium]